jgi:membrane protein insertase Oxa1/YidC/SpoIIIJ
MLCGTFAGNSVGQFTSVAAPDPNSALLLTLLFVIPMFLFSGCV